MVNGATVDNATVSARIATPMPHETPYERFLKALHKTVFSLDRYADRLLSENSHGTFSQFLVMTAIAKCPKVSQQKIAEFLNLTPAAVSRQIDVLVSAGFIARKEDPQSRRAHVIELTASGEKHYLELKSSLMDAFKDRLHLVKPSELESASATLEKVLFAIDPGAAGHSEKI